MLIKSQLVENEKGVKDLCLTLIKFYFDLKIVKKNCPHHN